MYLLQKRENIVKYIQVLHRGAAAHALVFYKIQGVVIWSGTVSKSFLDGLEDSIKTLKQTNHHVGFGVVHL